MHSTLIVAKMNVDDHQHVGDLFSEFDSTDMPSRMGTQRRELFYFQGLYFHIQNFAGDNGADRVENAKRDPRFVGISEDLRPYIEPYDPNWKSPRDAIATPFYRWTA
ncbi:TcmI family type II polyketide cyclase [Rhodococcus sp. H29-C3]|uniref:TcmI family type II polyketide cyclase n=1 Tax=Rhodococcus sp. H29-C3 TaxID=3046307 RepID=UPI0024B89A0C|nr:TcmI family type II polyketide cyclase [Rhodococcus sp. H29-C3]MDJ0362346.1 TcmI family type II polyketide cyclase [Rhodococcus sp. H29-C3]